MLIESLFKFSNTFIWTEIHCMHKITTGFLCSLTVIRGPTHVPKFRGVSLALTDHRFDATFYGFLRDGPLFLNKKHTLFMLCRHQK